MTTRESFSTVAAGQRVAHVETVRLRKDGQQIDVSLTVSPIRDANGEVIGASTVARDITEHNAQEIALSTPRSASGARSTTRRSGWR